MNIPRKRDTSFSMLTNLIHTRALEHVLRVFGNQVIVAFSSLGIILGKGLTTYSPPALFFFFF